MYGTGSVSINGNYPFIHGCAKIERYLFRNKERNIVPYDEFRECTDTVFLLRKITERKTYGTDSVRIIENDPYIHGYAHIFRGL